ncbi:MAG: PAC2 family protein [Anaerolineae bacterium]|jgi:predicted ATP-grasp superfamily ATP-dependent carboligase|nr:PAC2 family protein [Chloroflexota bacterium]
MEQLVRLWEVPETTENYMIAGFEQWADAGEISSGMPSYLIELTGAERIGSIRPDGFYFFQVPGTHHLLRPQIKLSNGHRERMSSHENNLYYANVGGKGLLIFRGEEPHQNEERYAEAFLDLVEATNVRRVVIAGGVYGAVPFDRDRDISCVYSLPRMKKELDQYALRYSNYEGGTTIGSYLAHQAEFRAIEMVVLNGFAPAYEFGQMGLTVQAMRVEEDWKAWLDILRRVDYMLHLGLDLSDLERRALSLIAAWQRKVAELEEKHPELGIKAHLDAIERDFQEHSFIPLDSAWDELGDILEDETTDD